MKSAQLDTGEQTITRSVGDAHFNLGKNTPYLSIIYPREFNRRFKLSERPLVIGRSRQADVMLNNELISRTHCQVKHTTEGVIVEDLGSTNGTMIDGKPIHRARLPVNGRLLLGTFVLKLEYKDMMEVNYEDKLFTAATTDPLTGIPNRQWLMERGMAEVENLKNSEHVLSVVIMDIDFFKSVNDSHGHQAGDVIIRGVAQLLLREKREQDLLGRYGGEEFVMFLPFITGGNAAVFCERIRRQVETNVFEFRGTRIPITVSIGVCSQPGVAINSLEDVIRRADEALYRAKNQGRNRVVCIS